MTDHSTSKLTSVRRVLVVLAATMLALTIGLGAASSASTTGKSGRDSVVERSAAQAKAAGLTDSQVRGLQAKTDRFIADHGGTQVAPGRILLKDGKSFVQLGVPGERSPRDLRSTAAPLQSCPYYYFCAYRGGDVLSYYYCNAEFMPWTGNGWYVNNQTPGTRAHFLNSTRGHYGWSCAAYCQVGSINWSPIYYIDPC